MVAHKYLTLAVRIAVCVIGVVGPLFIAHATLPWMSQQFPPTSAAIISGIAQIFIGAGILATAEPKSRAWRTTRLGVHLAVPFDDSKLVRLVFRINAAVLLGATYYLAAQISVGKPVWAVLFALVMIGCALRAAGMPWIMLVVLAILECQTWRLYLLYDEAAMLGARMITAVGISAYLLYRMQFRKQ